MTTTRNRPPAKGQPKRPEQAYTTVSAPFIEEERQAQEWHAFLPIPPITPAQLRQEYNDALSFLLLLESRINRLEEAEMAEKARAKGEQPAPRAKVYFLSARSRAHRPRA